MGEPGKILITGAAGFVGVALCRRLAGLGLPLRAVVRRGGTPLPRALAASLDDVVSVDGLTDSRVWGTLLEGVDAVVHLAARTHCFDNEGASSDLYFRDNLDAGVALGETAQQSGVRRLIFLSTIKVNGEGAWGDDRQPFKVSDRLRPQGPYAISKWRTEQELRRLCQGAQTPTLTIIRPPLIYGAGAKGNLALLQKWIVRGLPLPIPRGGNRRSLLDLESLVGFIEFYLLHPEANPQTVLVADQQDWSTARFFAATAQKLGRRARLFQVPLFWLRVASTITRQETLFIKMFGSLRVDGRMKARSFVGSRQALSKKAPTV